MEGEGEGGVSILIRTKSSKDSVGNRWSEFHKVDPEQGKLQENWFPRLQTWNGLGQMVLGGKKLYVIGGETEDRDGEHAFVLDPNLDWKHFRLPVPQKLQFYPMCASLDEKIYQVPRRGKYSCDREAFAATLEFWNCIRPPPEFDARAAVCKPVADPANKRILVSFYKCTCLYLCFYYPQDHSMRPIREGDDFPWSNAVALVEKVAYVHSCEPSFPQLLYAFDVSEEGKGKSLNVSWTSTMVQAMFKGSLFKFNMSGLEFKALFHVGNNNFWSAYWHPVVEGEDHVFVWRVYFVKFKACRSGDDIIYTLESTGGVVDLVLLA